MPYNVNVFRPPRNVWVLSSRQTCLLYVPEDVSQPARRLLQLVLNGNFTLRVRHLPINILERA